MAVVNFGLDNYSTTKLPNFKIIKNTDSLWRFMPLQSFLMMLSNSAIWFARHDVFEDKFEGQVPQHWVDDSNVFNAEKTIAYVSCWYRGDYEPVNMWKFYGKDECSVCIRTNAERFKNVLVNSDTPNSFPFNIDNINYIDFNDKNIKSPEHLTFTRDGDYSYFLVKRHNFKDENETRVYFVDLIRRGEDIEDKSNGFDIKIDLDSLIDKIIISPYSNEKIILAIKRLLKSYNISAKVNKSSILTSTI